MKMVSAYEPEMLKKEQESEISLSLQLLGFEHLKDYVLTSNPEEAPFFWLQVANDPNLAFLVIEPCFTNASYHPDVNDRDVVALGVEEADDALLFNIVTLHKEGPPTVNLKGPILVNRHTWVGKQVVLDNAPDYSVNHPLPVES